MENVEFIGFTLPATSVSSKIIPINSDVTFINLYSSILCFLYAVSISFFTVWYYHSKKVKKTVNRLINGNTDLSMGIRITSTTALVIEFTARLATCITWTQNIDHSLSIVLAVWMPQIHLLLMAAWQIIFVSCYVSYQKKKEDYNKRKEEDADGESRGRCDCNSQSELRTFSNMCATVFGLFYMLFPTIILMFAHPTQIIVIFTFVIAYLFATTIFTASIIRLYKHLTKGKSNIHNHDNLENEPVSDRKPQKNLDKHWPLHVLKILFTILIFITLWLVVIYLHFLVVFISYSLLIGRGSVINTGPLFLISLLPSAILSGGAWIAKRVALNNEPDLESTSKESKGETGKESKQNEGSFCHDKKSVQQLNGTNGKCDSHKNNNIIIIAEDKV